MAYLLFAENPVGNIRVQGVNLTENVWSDLVSYGEGWVFEFDLGEDILPSSLTLNADKTAVVNLQEGEDFDTQLAFAEAEADLIVLENKRASKIKRIKSHVLEVLESIEWRSERALELDTIDGGTSRQLKVAQWKQAARDMNNAKEAEVAALTTIAEIEAYDADWKPEFYAANPTNF